MNKVLSAANKNNSAKVAGVVVTKPIKYTCYGKVFYAFDLCVKRMSGTEDLIPVNMPVVLREELNFGDEICLIGQIRTYNKVLDGKCRLIVAFFAIETAEYEGYENDVDLKGFFLQTARSSQHPARTRYLRRANRGKQRVAQI